VWQVRDPGSASLYSVGAYRPTPEEIDGVFRVPSLPERERPLFPASWGSEAGRASGGVCADSARGPPADGWRHGFLEEMGYSVGGEQQVEQRRRLLLSELGASRSAPYPTVDRPFAAAAAPGFAAPVDRPALFARAPGSTGRSSPESRRVSEASSAVDLQLLSEHIAGLSTSG
jgi:hypothetical protein